MYYYTIDKIVYYINLLYLEYAMTLTNKNMAPPAEQHEMMTNQEYGPPDELGERDTFMANRLVTAVMRATDALRQVRMRSSRIN